MGIPLRVALPLLVLVVAIIMVITTFVPLYLSGEQTGLEFSRVTRSEVGARIGAETMAFFTPFHHMVSGVQSLAKFDIVNASSIETALIPKICDAHGKVNFSTYFGMETGLFIKCISFSPGRYYAQARHITYFNEYHLDENYTIIGGNTNLTINYDPRARPWYDQLKYSNGYSKIYLNFSSTGTGTTTTTIGGPIYDTSGTTLLGVMASDVFPTDVVEYFSGVRVATSGHGMLVEETTNNVLGADVAIPGLGSAKIPLQNVSGIYLSAAAKDAALRAMACKLSTTNVVCHTTYGTGRDRVSVESRRADPTGALPFRVVLLIPEADFLGTLWLRTDVTIGVIVPVTVIILIIAVIAAAGLLTPLSNLTATMEGMADFSNLDAEAIEESVWSEVVVVQTTLKRVVVQMMELKKFIPQNVMMEGWSDDEEEEVDTKSSTTAGSHPLKSNGGLSTTESEQQEDHEAAASLQVDPVAPKLTIEDENSTDFRGKSPKPQEDVSRANSNDGSVALRDASYKLNVTKLQKSVNTFSSKRCSILIAELALEKCRTRQETQDAVRFFTDAVIGSALNNKGVIEVLRPEMLILTFSTIMHETHAVNTAIHIAQQCSRWAGLDMVTVAVDSGEYMRGNCGSRDRFANVVFGPMISVLRKLPSLAHVFKGTMLLLTEATAKKADIAGFCMFPVDVVQPQHLVSRGVAGSALRLYDICPDEPRFAAEQCRAAFTALLEGDFERAEAALAVEGYEQNPHCVRLGNRCKTLKETSMTGAAIDHIARREVFPWEEKGDLAPIEKSKHNDFPAFSHRFLAEDDELGNMGTLLAGGGRDQGQNVKNMLQKAQDSIKAEKQAAQPVFNDEPDEGVFSFFAIAPPAPEPTTDENGAVEDESAIPVTFQDDKKCHWHRSELVLGKGTFGAVYQGMSDQGVLAALKFLELKHDTELSDMETEVDALTRLENENIVQFISAAVTKKYLVFLLEYVPGGSLVTMMKFYENQLPPMVVKKFGRDILLGLAYLHENHVVHCDIKPGNVLLAGDGTCKITDFGSAVLGKKSNDFYASVRGGASGNSAGEAGKTNDTGLRGTLKYMAPEVAESTAPVAASDIWSWAITMCELATGELPWKHLPKGTGQMGFLQKMAEREVSPVIPEPTAGNSVSRSMTSQSSSAGDGNARVPSSLASMLKRCWAPSPNDRPTANELLNDPYFM